MSRQRLDLTGNRFGRLVVVREVEKAGYHRRYLCRCDCGNEVIVRQNNLRGHTATSCGCYQSERTSAANGDDLRGQRFGRLVVKERAPNYEGSRRVYWACICDCGTPAIVQTGHLKDGTATSCGCRRVESGTDVQKYNRDNMYSDGVFVPVLKSKLRADNKTGVKGVSERLRKNGTVSYQAAIRVKGKTYSLGEYETIAQAAKARRVGEEKYHAPYLEKQEE